MNRNLQATINSKKITGVERRYILNSLKISQISPLMAWILLRINRIYIKKASTLHILESQTEAKLATPLLLCKF